MSVVPVITYDPELDDAREWMVTKERCLACGLEWVGVVRVDRRAPTCPRCVVTDRNTSRRAP